MKPRALPVLLSTLSLLPNLVACADGDTPKETTPLEPLVLDSNLAVCEHIHTYYYAPSHTCEGVTDSAPYSLPSGTPFRAPSDRALILKNVDIIITGYNVGFDFYFYPVEIINSKITSTHGCLFYLGPSTADLLTLTSGIFSTEKTVPSPGRYYLASHPDYVSDQEPVFSNVPSPFCVLSDNLATSADFLQSVLGTNSAYFLPDSASPLNLQENLIDGSSAVGKLGYWEVKYLSSPVVLVKDLSASGSVEPTPVASDPTELDSDVTDPADPSSAEPGRGEFSPANPEDLKAKTQKSEPDFLLPKAPNAGKK